LSPSHSTHTVSTICEQKFAPQTARKMWRTALTKMKSGAGVPGIRVQNEVRPRNLTAAAPSPDVALCSTFVRFPAVGLLSPTEGLKCRWFTGATPIGRVEQLVVWAWSRRLRPLHQPQSVSGLLSVCHFLDIALQGLNQASPRRALCCSHI
jgi:hypothetical protein